MKNDIIEEIEKKIEKLKVTNYQEKKKSINSNFLSIVEGTYHLNNGQDIKRETVIKNNGSGDAVCIFAITKENKIVLVIQPRVSLPTKDKVNIELPAGYIEKDEEVIETAKRELKEETGYVSSNFTYLDSYFPSQGASSEKIHLFLALGCEKKENQSLDIDEFVEFIEVDFSTYEYLLENNYMLDANARIAYYKVGEYFIQNYLSKIVSKLITKNKTISTMESCTGGYLASCITNIPDSSRVLKYSAVTYSNEFKIKMGVSQEVIDKYSVYSIECAREMAYHISNFTSSDYGIGVTGTLKKYDENNPTKENDKVYVSIYDKDTNTYYDYQYCVQSNNRLHCKRNIIINIAHQLNQII